MQRRLVVSGVVVAPTAFGLLVYGYERYYRGPKQSALFGTWSAHPVAIIKFTSD